MVRLCIYRKNCEMYDGGKSCIMGIGCGLRANYEFEKKIMIKKN